MLATRMLENRRNRRWCGVNDGIRLYSDIYSHADRCAATVPRPAPGGLCRSCPRRKSPTAERGVGRSPAPAAASILCLPATSSLPRQGCALARNRTELDSPATCFRSRMRRRTGARACERSDTDRTHDAPACRGVVRCRHGSLDGWLWVVQPCRRAVDADRRSGTRRRGGGTCPSAPSWRRGHGASLPPGQRARDAIGGKRAVLSQFKSAGCQRTRRRILQPRPHGRPQLPVRHRAPGPESYNAQSTRIPATHAFGRSCRRAGSLNWSGCTM
jgi:hypothetical protein